MTRHESQRGYFAAALHQVMENNPDVWLLLGDLGYKVFDQHRLDFPERVINVGAAEQAMLDMAVGLASEGKIPVCYSITTFLLYRPFETLRTYINYERLNVKLIASGRDRDYAHDGISHWSNDDRLFLEPLYAIDAHWPETKEEITHEFIKELIETPKPVYINLTR